MSFILIVLGYLISGSLALIGQVPQAAEVFGSWIQYGALGLLGITVVGQLYIIVIRQQSLFNSHKEMSDRAHCDSMALNETLTRLRENCAAVSRQGGKKQ